MRKKYLSALLFGALLMASTATFTSCKDYDDDINDLQSQITANAEAIRTLQTLVESGRYVSAVSNSGNVITFTFSDGTTQNVTVDTASQTSQVVEVREGELYIDGEATGIKVAEEVETETGLVKALNGTWWVMGENGEYTNTNIPVSAVTVSGSEADGYTFTIYAADGTSQSVKLPTAASSITSITLANGATTFKFFQKEFKFDRNESGLLSKASDWKGTKTLPNDYDYILCSDSKIDIRVNPVSVDITNVPFYLTNTKNADLSTVVLKATAESGDEPMTNTNGRAANIGNGLWTLTMDNTVVAKEDWDDVSEDIWGAVFGNYAYALNAGHSCRSLYGLAVEYNQPGTLLQSISLKQGSSPASDPINVSPAGATDTASGTYKVGSAVTVNASTAYDLYDMYLEADASDVNVYGLTFDQANHTFTIGKNPDVSSVNADFDLIVWTVDNLGNIYKNVVTVNIDSEINAGTEYSLINHNVNVTNPVKNYFGIDLATMKTALGDNLDAWLQNVDLTKTSYEFAYNGENSFDPSLPAGFEANFVATLNDKKTVNTNRNEAAYIQVNIDNDEVQGLSLDYTYYIRASFKTAGGDVLNTIVVPVEFHAPALSELFTIKEGYVANNVINAYFYNVNTTAVELDRYFNTFVEDATFAFQTGNVDDTNKTAAQLFTRSGSDFGTGAIDLSGDYTNKVPDGYGKAVTINVTKADYNNWLYTTEGDDEYSFQIRLMSPIYEGTVAPVSGTTISINGNDLVNGYDITSSQIIGRDYNNNTYNVVADKYVDGIAKAWANPQIAEVTAGQDDAKYLKLPELTPATQDATTKVVTNGVIKVTGESISQTVTTEMPVTVEDVWGYKKTVDVSITIVKND